MELDDLQLREEKKILLETLRKFQKICSMYNLKYYAGYGTCLGAVRHKGFIPWDDDIDVLMPRADYDKFLKLKKQAIEDNCEIIDYSNNKLYYSFAKFCDMNTTIVELQTNKVVHGVFIDVFPLDDADDSDNTRKLYKDSIRCQELLLEVCKDISITSVVDYFKSNCWVKSLKCLYHLLYQCVFRPHRYRRFLKNEDILRQQKGEYYLHYYGCYGYSKDLYKKKWFDQTVEVPFENMSILIPKDYDGYLTSIYGDYMKLPPIEQQVGHHNIYFFDLNKRWTLEDIECLNLGEQVLKDWYRYE